MAQDAETEAMKISGDENNEAIPGLVGDANGMELLREVVEDGEHKPLSEDDVVEEIVMEKTGLSDIPNGGLTAWLQVSGSFFLFMNSWGISNTFGAFEAYYIDINLSNKTASDIAWIGSMQNFLLLIIGVFTGPMFDQGYFRSFILLSTFMITFGMMMLSLCKEYWQVMLAQALVVGLGSGFMFIPCVAVIPQYFTSKRILATGIAASGSSLGGVIYPIIFHKLEPRVGFGWATRVIGFIMLATQCWSLAVMRLRVPPSTGPRKLFDASALREPPFIALSLAIFLGFMGVYIPFYYIQEYAVSNGIFKSETAFYLLTILNAASVFGRIVPNFLADKTGPMNILIPFTVIASIIAFTWTSATSKAGIVLIAVFYGFFSGTFVSLPPSCIIAVTPDLGVLGTRMGMVFSLCSIGLLVGTPIAGAILDNSGYTATSIFCGCIVMASAGLVTASRLFKTGLKFKART
ncbi:MFS monocarboxylate transporter-like protein [Myxozyma melibiosi]|uniref:MFS monocarboxylate transporter-like protein n=1 Tax=Myxozyma melibiosi TaxID=54550 RepID=A0ABR1EXU7_9ASCO